MRKPTFFAGLCGVWVHRWGIVVLAVLMWSHSACCGEVADPAPSANLFTALRKRDSETAMALLKANPDLVFSKGPNAWTPLHWASFHGFEPMVRWLLANKAEVNAKGRPNSETPLSLAAGRGRVDVARLLVANNAEYTIHEVAAVGDLERVRTLLKANPDLISSRDRRGEFPLHLAVTWGRKDVAELLLANNAGYTIHEMAAIGDLERIRTLLKANPDLISSRDTDGEFPLHSAAFRNQKDAVELLLANHADINCQAGGFGTPLHAAASRGYTGVVKVLLEHDARINAKDEEDYTPLHFAAREGHNEMAELLRQHGGH